MIFGQSNVRTFEGQRYHMCGEGDFVLLNSSDVKIVGRFQKSPFNGKPIQSFEVPYFEFWIHWFGVNSKFKIKTRNGKLRYSDKLLTIVRDWILTTLLLLAQYDKSVILTAVGIQVRQEVIEIKLKGPEVDRSMRTLDVLVNGEFQYFDQGPQRWKDFQGMLQY